MALPVAGITIKLDGANLTDAGSMGSNLQNINDSFVSEVHVQTSNFGADQSNGPVIISGVTKSGTKTYHGSLYTYARTYQLNSNDWLDKYNGTARPVDRFIYPGATISGPVPFIKKMTFLSGAETLMRNGTCLPMAAQAAPSFMHWCRPRLCGEAILAPRLYPHISAMQPSATTAR